MHAIRFHPELKKTYIARFGEEEWKKNLHHTLRYLDGAAGPAGWVLPNMIQSLILMMLGMAQNHGLKAAHPPLSIVASGTFVLSDEAMKTFQSTQKIFPLLLRHTYNLQLSHPLQKGVRSLAMEIGNFFHPTLLSGEACPFFNLETFQSFGSAMRNLETSVLEEFKQHPTLMNSITASLVNQPSYMKLHYFSMMTYDLKNRLVRFRVVPLEVISRGKKYKLVRTEPPVLSQAKIDEFLQPGKFFSAQEEKQPTDIYETDYAQRLKESPDHALHYLMEYQVMDIPSDPVEEGLLRNSSLVWDERKAPYQEFGRVRVTTLVKDDNTSAFDVTLMPASMTLATAPSVLDPRIIGQVRSFVYPKMQQLRKLWGSCVGF